MATISVTSDKNIKDLTSAMWIMVSGGSASSNAAGSAALDPTAAWTTRAIQSATWQDICYGLNLVVAVASNNYASCTLDGTTWMAGVLASGLTGSWKSVAFGDDRFIAISNNSRATMYSLDGAYWQAGTDLPTGTNNTWQKICYGGGTWVAIEGGSGTASSKAAYSTDNGSTWTEVALPASRDWRSVTYGNGLFVAVAYGTDKLATSTDGITWTERTASSSSNWVSVCYGNGYYVAVAYNTAKSMRSTDGISWEEVALTATANWNCITFGECTDAVGKNGKGIFLVSAYGSSTLQCSESYSSGSMSSWGADTVSTTANWIGHCFAPNFDGNTLNILDGAIITVDDPYAHPTAWRDINITNGKLNITNTSTTKGLRFFMTKLASSSTPNDIVVSGLGELNINGDWIELGTGDGTASQTFNFWSTDLVAAVWVETSPGSGTYEPWINVTNQPDECPYYGWSKDIMTYADSAGKYFKQGWRAEPYTYTDRICNESSSTLTFGNGTNGAVVPTGCKVRVPNIVLSDNSMNQYFSTSINYGCLIDLSASGVLNIDTCLLDCCRINGTSAKSMHVADVGMVYTPAITRQNDLVINTMIITDCPVRVLYPSATPTVRTLFYGRFPGSGYYWSYLNGATINNLYKILNYGVVAYQADTCYSLVFQYCDDITINGLQCSIIGGFITRWALMFDYVNNSFLSNIKPEGGMWTIQNCSNTNVNGLEFLSHSMGKPNATYGIYAIWPTARYYDNNGNPWVDGEKQYFKYAFPSDLCFLYPAYTDNYAYCVVPFTPEDESFPYFAGVHPSVNSVSIYWSPNVQPQHTSPAYEVYRDISSITKSTVTFNGSGTAVVAWPNHGFSAGQPVTFAPVKLSESVVSFSIANPTVITWINHGLSTGDPVCFYVNAGGIVPTGLTEGTTYYVRPDSSLNSANEFWLYSTYASAVAGGHTNRQQITYNNQCTLNCVKLSTFPTGITANTTYYARPDTSLDETNEFWLYTSAAQAITGGSTGRQSVVTAGSGSFLGISADIIYTVNTTTIDSYTDSTAINNTTYYYMLRKYKSGQVFYDSPIWDATPQALRPINNYCLQSEAFDSSTWTKTGCSATATAKRSPVSGSSSNDGERLTSSNANATVTQTVSGLTAGTTYTFGILLSADDAGVGVELKLTGGTASATLACDLHADWRLFTLQITPSGTSVTVQIGGNDLGANYQFGVGKIIYASCANLDVGTSLDHYTSTTNAVVTNLATYRLGRCLWNWKNRSVNVYYTYTTGYWRGQIPVEMLCHDTSPDFTASYLNTIGFAAAASRNFINNTNCVFSNFTHSDREKWLAPSGGYPYIFSISNCSSCKFIDFIIHNAGYDCSIIAYLGSGCKDLLLANWSIPELNKSQHSGSISVGSPIYYSGPDVSNITLQNIKFGDSYLYPTFGVLGKNVIHKGVQAGSATDAKTLGLGYANTTTRAYTSVFDTNFFEHYTGPTEGILSVRFCDTENTVNPTITKTTGCGFDCTGKLYIWSQEAEVVMTVPYTLYATTGFRNIEPRYNSTFWVSTSYNDIMRKPLALSVQYSIDGGAYKELTAANLYAETITDGFTFSLKFTVRGKVIEWDAPLNNFPEEYRPQTGDAVVGWTSGATGTILADGIYNCGIYGQILLGSATGVFVNNESLFKQGPEVTMDITAPGVVNWANHGLNTGDAVRFRTTGGLPAGIALNTFYYVIYINANSFWLATNYTNAVAGTKITFTGTQSGAHTGYVYLAQTNMPTTYADNSMPNAGTYIDAIDIFTTVDQSIQYPIFVADLTFNGLVEGTEIRVYRASDGYELGGIESSGTSWTMEYEWPEEDVVVNIAILSLGHLPQWFSNVSLGQDGYTMLVQQQRDRQYLNP